MKELLCTIGETSVFFLDSTSWAISTLRQVDKLDEPLLLQSLVGILNPTQQVVLEGREVQKRDCWDALEKPPTSNRCIVQCGFFVFPWQNLRGCVDAEEHLELPEQICRSLEAVGLDATQDAVSKTAIFTT